MDYIYQQNMLRTLLANGFDTRTTRSHGLRARITINDQTTIINQLDNGEKELCLRIPFHPGL